MNNLESFEKLIDSSEKITFITGAGISAESGVPTFRGSNGLWKNYRAEELATPYAFEKNPEIVWEWYNWRRELISKCVPNPAHYFISGLEGSKDTFLITQNVDGLHKKAGSKNLVEIHGSIWKIKCVNCTYSEENYKVPLTFPPTCQKCGSLMRPAVIWFGESLIGTDLDRAVKECLNCDLLIVIGTSAVVQPVASFPFQAKRHNNKIKIIDINPVKNDISEIADLYIQENSGEFLKNFI
jgi:NAD-dependent deacetylase